jgi:hypothetical protein
MAKLRKKMLFTLGKGHRSEVVLKIDVRFCRGQHFPGNHIFSM